jgi:hypothetical protein
MKDKQPEQDPDLTPQQVTARMVAALRKAHAMPPKEQKDMRLGKPNKRRQKAPSLHFSDCAVNNAPALEPGHCTCSGIKVGR